MLIKNLIEPVTKEGLHNAKVVNVRKRNTALLWWYTVLRVIIGRENHIIELTRAQLSLPLLRLLLTWFANHNIKESCMLLFVLYFDVMFNDVRDNMNSCFMKHVAHREITHCLHQLQQQQGFRMLCSKFICPFV